MRKLIQRLANDERGATAIEYGMICALMFLVACGSMAAMGTNATALFFRTAAAVASVK